MADLEQHDLSNDDDQALGQNNTTASTVEASSPVHSSDAPTTPRTLQADSESRAVVSPAPQEEHPTEKGKIDVLLKAVGDAPIMKKKRWAVDSNKKIAWVADFVRKYIKCEPHESLVRSFSQVQWDRRLNIFLSSFYM